MKYLVLLYLRVSLTKKNDYQSQRESYRQYSNTTEIVEEKMVFMPEPTRYNPTCLMMLDQHVGLV